MGVKVQKSKRKDQKRSGGGGQKAQKRKNKRLQAKKEGLAGKPSRKEKKKGGKWQQKGKFALQHQVPANQPHPLKDAFAKVAREYVKQRRRSRRPRSSNPVERVLDDFFVHTHPAGFFDVVPPPPPHGHFLDVTEVLELLSKLEKPSKKQIKRPREDEEAPAAKDKDKEAVDRARKLLEERKKVLPYFEPLRSGAAKTRRDGATAMAKYVKGLGCKAPDAGATTSQIEKALGPSVTYIMQRLVKGMGSGDGGSRVGFAEALAKVLEGVPEIPLDYVYTLTDANLSMGGKGEQLSSEQKHSTWGVAFVVAAVLASGRALGKADILVLQEKAMSVHSHLPAARELVGCLLARMLLNSGKGLVQGTILPKLHSDWFSSKMELWSAEAVYLYFTIHLNGVELPSGPLQETLLPPSAPGVAKRLATCLLDGKAPVSLRFHPKVHAVWDAWVEYVSKGAAVSRSKCSVEGRLRALWEHVMLGFLSKADEDNELHPTEQRAKRLLADWLVARLVDIIMHAPVSKLRNRTVLLADFCHTHPNVAAELWRRGKDGAVQHVKDDLEETVGALMQQFAEVGEDAVKKKFATTEPRSKSATEKKDKKKKKRDEDEDDEEEEEDEEDEDEVPASDDEEDDEREGYFRFAFNLRKVLMAELKSVALQEGVLRYHAPIYERILHFFMKHAFFTIPSGAVDSGGMLTIESLPWILRGLALDAFFTLVRHIDVATSGKRSEAEATRKVTTQILPGLVKAHQRHRKDPGIEMLWPAGENVLAGMDHVAKHLTKKGEAGTAIAPQHRPHLECLLALVYFGLAAEAEALEATPEVLEGIVDAADDIGGMPQSGDMKLLLDAVLTLTLRSNEPHTQHLGAMINKVGYAVMEHVITPNLKDPSALEILLAPLSEQGFGVADDGKDEEEDAFGTLEDESDESDDDDEDAVPQAKVPEKATMPLPISKGKQKKLEQEKLQAEIQQARVRALHYLNLYVEKRGVDSPAISQIIIPVVRLAELSLPRAKKKGSKKHAGWGDKDVSRMQSQAPVLAACCTTLTQFCKAPLSAMKKAWGPDTASDLTAAIEFVGRVVAKDKEKMHQREGRHFKLCLCRCLLHLVSMVHIVSPTDETLKAILPSLIAVLRVRDLSVQVMEQQLADYLSRCPAAMAWAIIPAITAGLEQATRPYHRTVMLSIAQGVASKWAALAALQKDHPEVHSRALESLSKCCYCSITGDAEKDQAVLAPTVNLVTTLVRYWDKCGERKAGKYTRDGFREHAKKLIEDVVRNSSIIDLTLRAALRKAWSFVKPDLDYQRDVGAKPRKQPKNTAPTVVPGSNEETETTEANGEPKKKKKKAGKQGGVHASPEQPAEKEAGEGEEESGKPSKKKKKQRDLDEGTDEPKTKKKKKDLPEVPVKKQKTTDLEEVLSKKKKKKHAA